jgi:tRNA (cmo5U34)-methyltransferase
MNNVEIFENERATGYNQFVETWIPNYHYFLDRLPKLLSETKQKDLLVVGCGE